MKKVLSISMCLCIILSLFTFVSLPASAETIYTSGDFKYTVSNDEASITDYTGSETILEIPSKLGNYNVTRIYNWAFYNCKSLTSVTIPKSVTSIGYKAFENCALLTSITIPNSVTSIGEYAFSGCTLLTSIIIPSSVTNIGSFAFSGCTSLTRITIPDSVTSIGSSAFYNTGYYNNTANWEDNVLYIGNFLISGKYKKYDEKTNTYDTVFEVSGDYSIKQGTKVIAEKAFEKCTSLISITIPKSITSIYYSTFYMCISLTNVMISNGVTSIGYSAFEKCISLTSITIPNSVTSIGSNAFYNCISLTSVTIPDSVTLIDYYAFNKTITLITSCNNTYVIKYARNNYYKLSLNHNYAFESEKPATCYEDGVKNYICTYCKVTHSETIMAGHDFQWIVVKKATCTKEGEKEYKCTRCNYVEKTESIKKIPLVSSGKLPVVAKKLKSPKVKITSGKKQIKIKYTKVKNAVGFKVRYKINGKWKYKTFKTKKSVTKTISGLKKGKYKVQVCAFTNGKKAFSDWTKIKTVKVK